MRVVIEKSTGIALYMFDDQQEVVITDTMMASPCKAHDIKAETHEVVSAPAPAQWIGGGALGFGADGWQVASQELYDGFMSNPENFPLEPWQFKAMVIYLDKDADIRTAIAAIADPMQRAWSLSRYDNVSAYRFEDPFLQQMRGAVGMTKEELKTAWLLARDLKA